MAINGLKCSVLWIMTCPTSQGSAIELSVYTSIPLQPASSLHRATSATFCRYKLLSTSFDCEQVEKTSMEFPPDRSRTLARSELALIFLPLDGPLSGLLNEGHVELTTRELAQRLAYGHLVASDHSQNVTGFVETDVNMAGKPVAGDQSN